MANIFRQWIGKNRRPITLSRFSLLCSIFTFFFNIPFLQFLFQHAETDSLPGQFLIASVLVLLILLHYFVYYLLVFLLRPVGKGIIALWFVLNACCTYFVITYHTMMDESMLGNVFNTRYSEASGFFSLPLVLFVLLLGILPATLILRARIQQGTWKRFGLSAGGSLAASLILILLNFNQTLWISKYDTELGGLVMPWSYTVNTIRLVNHKVKKEEKEILLPDARFADNEKSVMVLVIGESARKANFQLYGYRRATNPRLSALPDLHVINANSCATYTTAGTKSILEYTSTSKLYEILPNYLYRTGADVVWRTSNWGEPPVHIPEYATRKQLVSQYAWTGEVHDEVLTCGLRERIQESTMNKILIVLHTSTSHGPDYQHQYPAEFEVFTPVCSKIEEAQKDRSKLVNAYDNSVIYTDYILTNIIDTLRTLTDWHTAMLYVSDHGESLGEDGLFMHGVPLKMAPREQYEIPMLLWVGDNHRKVSPSGQTRDQHVVFHTVLDFLSVESEIFNKEQSLFAQ